MKNILVLLVIAFAACSKPRHIKPVPTLVGEWQAVDAGWNIAQMKPSFTRDTMSLWGVKYRYTVAGDTIYKFYDAITVEAVFSYRLISYDSILLAPVFSMMPDAVFCRVR